MTLDDATNEHYSMFFVEQEGTFSSFRGTREVIEQHGLFCSLYTDRGSHYWHTPEAGGKVDKHNLTRFGRAFVPLFGRDVAGILCEHQERVVGKDHCVSFAGKRLQVPPDPHRTH